MAKPADQIQFLVDAAEKVATGKLPTEVFLFPVLERLALATEAFVERHPDTPPKAARLDTVIGYKGVMYRVIVDDARRLEHIPMPDHGGVG